MKVVVIGSGAREHALVRALLRGAQAGGPREVVAIPGMVVALDRKPRQQKRLGGGSGPLASFPTGSEVRCQHGESR